jgi:hypothetical protein
MSKKYKCTVVETYTKFVEIPDNMDITDIDLSEVYDFSMPEDSEETVTPIRNDSVVDLVYKDGEFQIVVQERFSKSLEDKPKKDLPKGTKLEDLF